MFDKKSIALVVDYHDNNLKIRWLNAATGEERMMSRPTSRCGILALVDQAAREAAESGGEVVWIMESTTGWARVKTLLDGRARFLLANVLQMPLPPKAYRRKTDKIDTGRMLREYLAETLPLAHPTRPGYRRVRRLASCREDLVRRRTALRNWINRYLAHETWQSRTGLWSGKGGERLAQFIDSLGTANPDALVLKLKLAALAALSEQLDEVESAMRDIWQMWPMAQWVDEIRGIGLIAAVSILAHIGSVGRFRDAESLISFAGLAPGIRQSDGRSQDLHIGGGGTDKKLRHYLIEASVWARQLPRYQPTYERVAARHGKKVGRIVVARMLLRSIYKMLRGHIRFNQVQVA